MGTLVNCQRTVANCYKVPTIWEKYMEKYIYVPGDTTRGAGTLAVHSAQKQGCRLQQSKCTLRCSEGCIPRCRIVGLLATVRDQCPWQHLRLNKGGGFDTGPSLVVSLANRLVDLEHIGTKPGTSLVVLILRSEWAHEIMDGASRRARPVARNPSRVSRRERQPTRAQKAKNTRPEGDQGQ